VKDYLCVINDEVEGSGDPVLRGVLDHFNLTIEQIYWITVPSEDGKLTFVFLKEIKASA